MKNYILHIHILLIFILAAVRPAKAQLTEPNGEYGGPVSALVIKGPELFAGTVGGGVWSRNLSSMLTDIKSFNNVKPTSYSLNQNYPNPFNPATIISYTLEQGSEVNLVVFNSIGEQVLELFNGTQEAGSYEIRFNAAGLSSGVYFYRLKAGAFIKTRKLVLLR